eukprot:6077763-Ditylum_brightwellii.AAC.1
MAELLVITVPQVYKQCVRIDRKGDKLSQDLIDNGFEINPNVPCVANKKVSGHQLTVTWHVDDLKVSHKKKKVVDNFLQWLGSKHDRKIGDIVASLAADHLFQVDPGGEKLNEELAQAFHTIVARLIYVCKCARQDLQTAIAFLTTRVKAPDNHDWEKWKCLLRYLKGTINLMLSLTADNPNMIKWWVNGAYAVHEDMKSHTGVTMTLGKGSVYSMSNKEKLNTKSSTETELVGVNDALPVILWNNVKKLVVFQDNKSAILLEENGKASSGKRTRHINIRYFLVQDWIEKRELKVEYCQTDGMVGDYFSKPIQGRKFRIFRKQILNHRSIDCIDPPWECDGEDTNKVDKQNTNKTDKQNTQISIVHIDDNDDRLYSSDVVKANVPHGIKNEIPVSLSTPDCPTYIDVCTMKKESRRKNTKNT